MAIGRKMLRLQMSPASRFGLVLNHGQCRVAQCCCQVSITIVKITKRKSRIKSNVVM
jgi:hypothetical protein